MCWTRGILPVSAGISLPHMFTPGLCAPLDPHQLSRAVLCGSLPRDSAYGAPSSAALCPAEALLCALSIAVCISSSSLFSVGSGKYGLNFKGRLRSYLTFCACFCGVRSVFNFLGSKHLLLYVPSSSESSSLVLGISLAFWLHEAE